MYFFCIFLVCSIFSEYEIKGKMDPPFQLKDTNSWMHLNLSEVT